MRTLPRFPITIPSFCPSIQQNYIIVYHTIEHTFANIKIVIFNIDSIQNCIRLIMFPPFKEELIFVGSLDSFGEEYQSEDADYAKIDPFSLFKNQVRKQGSHTDKTNIQQSKNNHKLPLTNQHIKKPGSFESGNNNRGLNQPVEDSYQIPIQVLTPTKEEIEGALQKIRRTFPNINIISLATKLYYWVRSRKQKQQTKSSTHSKHYNLQQEQQNQDVDEFKQTYLQKSRIIELGGNQFIVTNKGMLPKKEALLKRFNKIKTMKQYRAIEREVGARAFCYKGYGIPMLRKQIEQLGIDIQINDKRYKAVSCGFVTQTYRRMEKFMINDCSQAMKGTTSNELKVLYTILLNCRDNFDQQEAKTFVKFVQLTFELAEVEISLEETFKLYHKFIESLYIKVKQQKYNVSDGTFEILKQSKNIGMLDLKPNLDKLWTPQREKEFLIVYLKEKTLSAVRDYFKEQYDPIKQEYYPKVISSVHSKNKSNYEGIQSSKEFSFYQTISDLKVITSKFHRTIRGGLRKIEYFSKKNPSTIKLLRANDIVIKSMFGNLDAADARQVIVQYQLQDTLTVDYVNSVIAVINQFIERKSNELDKRQKDVVQADQLGDD